MTTSRTAPYATGHIGLNVTDLRRSMAFYQEVFGFDALAESRDAGRSFVFLGYGDALVLTLWEQSTGAFPADRPGLHHLSFQVDSMDQVREAEGRARSVGARIFHGGVVPHQEGSASGGVFFADPDGIRLEVFAPGGAEAMTAPTPGAPTCGFF